MTLSLEAEASARIRRMWCALAEHAGADGAIRLSYVPHITLAVPPDETPVLDVVKAVSLAVGDWTAFTIAFAGFGVFPNTPPVVWAVPVVAAALLARHASLCAALGSFGIYPHYHPGHWVPHVTLSQESPSSARPIEVVTSMWDGPIITQLGKIELVRFLPVTILQSHPLKPEA